MPGAKIWVSLSSLFRHPAWNMERGGEDGERGSNERGGEDSGCHGHTISTCCTWRKCDCKMEGGRRGDGCVRHRSCLPAPTRRVCAHTFQPPQSKVEGSKTPWWLLKSEFPFSPSVSPRLPVDAATLTTLFGLEEEAWSQRAEDKVRIEENFTCPSAAPRRWQSFFLRTGGQAQSVAAAAGGKQDDGVPSPMTPPFENDKMVHYLLPGRNDEWLSSSTGLHCCTNRFLLLPQITITQI